MTDLTRLIRPQYKIENSGLEYIIFELYRNALESRLTYPSPEQKAKWKILWQMRATITLKEIRQQLAVLKPQKKHVNTLIGKRNVFSSMDSEDYKSQEADIDQELEKQDDTATYLTFDSFEVKKFGKVNFGKLQFVYKSNVDNGVIQVTMDNASEYLSSYGHDSIKNIVENLTSFEIYQQKLISILVNGYAYITHEIFDSEDVADLVAEQELFMGDSATDKNQVFRPLATALVEDKKVANLHKRTGFAFTELDLGLGKFKFPLDLNDLTQIDTARFNDTYPVKYSKVLRVGAAEEFLSKLGVHSKQLVKATTEEDGKEEEASPRRLYQKIVGAVKPVIFSSSGSASPPTPLLKRSPTPPVSISTARPGSFNLSSGQPSSPISPLGLNRASSADKLRRKSSSMRSGW